MDTPSVDDFLAETQEDDARKALQRALRQLDEAKSKKVALVEAVYQAARDAASGIDLTPVTAPKKTKRASDRKAESAIVVLSDWQLGKVTATYDSALCAERIATLGETVVSLTEIQRARHTVDECWVILGGDIVEGELIFPGQAHRIDASLFAQMMMVGPTVLGGFIRTMLATFDVVNVVGVIGNHGALGGRSRREMHPESNADAVLYETTRLALAGETRLSWRPTFTAGERHWYELLNVRGNTLFAFHGDQVKGGFAGFPWYGFGKKLLGWHKMYGPFDFAISGHFHTPVRGHYNGIVHWGNGSIESDNTYAAENLAASGEPSQWLLFMAERGVTAEYLVKL